MTASPYDGPLSELREHVEDLGAWLVIWCNRSEPDAQARRRASDAIDAMLRDLHTVRQQLIGEIREADDATAARLGRAVQAWEGAGSLPSGPAAQLLSAAPPRSSWPWT